MQAQTKNNYLLATESRPLGKVLVRIDVTGLKREDVSSRLDDLQEAYGHECDITTIRTHEQLPCFKRG